MDIDENEDTLKEDFSKNNGLSKIKRTENDEMKIYKVTQDEKPN